MASIQIADQLDADNDASKEIVQFLLSRISWSMDSWKEDKSLTIIHCSAETWSRQGVCLVSPGFDRPFFVRSSDCQKSEILTRETNMPTEAVGHCSGSLENML